MNKFIFFTAIVAFLINIPSVAQVDQRKYIYEGKIEKFRKIRNHGTVLTISGLGLAAVGTGLLISIQSDHNEDDNSLKFWYGICAAELGADMIIGGIILSMVGSHKIKQYRKKINNLSMGLIYTPERLGLSITYNFKLITQNINNLIF